MKSINTNTAKTRFFENSAKTEAIALVDNGHQRTVQWVKGGTNHLTFSQQQGHDGVLRLVRCSGVLVDKMEHHCVPRNEYLQRLQDAVLATLGTMQERQVPSKLFLHQPRELLDSFSF